MFPFLSFLNPKIKEENDILQDFLSRIEIVNWEKSHVILTPGSRCNHLYFILSGLTRASYLHKEKDISCHFTKKGEVMTAIDAFFQRKTTQYQLQALEKTEAASISYDNLHELFDLYPKFDRYGRELLIEEYGELVERVNHLQFFTAKERYQHFQEQHADLFQRVSLGQIASYLGITQETLSRIRKKDEMK